MDAKQKLFRQAAIDKQASPERLDEMMKVTAPAGWIALLAFAAVLAGVLVWSFYGRIPIRVYGQGILIRGAIREVTSSVSGYIVSVASVDDYLEEDDVVAVIKQPDLELRIENTRAELETLGRQSSEQEARSKTIIEQLRKQQTGLKEKLDALQELEDKGVLGRFSQLETKRGLSQLEQSIAEEEAKRSASRNRVDEVRRRLEELESKLGIEVPSPRKGRVREVAVDSGDLVEPGTRLLTLEVDDETSTRGRSCPMDSPRALTRAMVYIPTAEGKKVVECMEARVSPSTVKPEEYGSILGTVERVSRLSMTQAGMDRVLRNEKLVQILTAGGPVIEVEVTLHEDPDTDSGFHWTTSEGPPDVVSAGTPCSASVIIEHKKPIDYVLPSLKKALGEG